MFYRNIKKRTLKRDMIKESQIGKTNRSNWSGFNNVNMGSRACEHIIDQAHLRCISDVSVNDCLAGIPHSIASNSIRQYQAYYGPRNIRVYLSFKLYLQITWQLSESLLLEYRLIRWLFTLLVFHFFQYENDNVGRAYRL